MLNHILAAFMLLTRLPLWRIVEVPAESFKRIVPYCSVVAWLTSGVTALVLWLLVDEWVFYEVAIVLAMVARLWLTGALHEDGLADFFDGMGGGRDRAHTLAIMKDSHIGSYGVIGLVFYFLLYYTLLCKIVPYGIAPAVVLAGDTWSKFVASNVVNVLPYARQAAESKTGTVYQRMTPCEFGIAFVAGVLGITLLLPHTLLVAALAPVVTFGVLVLFMRQKIQGYTGDCCGALFLLCELSFYVAVAVLLFVNYPIVF